MKDSTPLRAPVPERDAEAYALGVADGERCRRSGGEPSIFLRVSFDDAYSAGFMDGFFHGSRGARRSMKMA